MYMIITLYRTVLGSWPKSTQWDPKVGSTKEYSKTGRRFLAFEGKVAEGEAARGKGVEASSVDQSQHDGTPRGESARRHGESGESFFKVYGLGRRPGPVL